MPVLPFSLPPPTGSDGVPDWMGNGFQVGAQMVSVLNYSENLDGWTDDLTILHEEIARDSHPIDLASRREAIRQLSLRHLPERPAILDIGCSSGHMLRDLAAAFPTAMVMGADVVRGPLERLAEDLPGVPLFRFDVQRCPLPSSVLDAVVMLNVLEHVSDDRAALDQVHRILKPGGLVVIEVPAGPHLFDDSDRALKHFRRYRLADLTCALERVGFRVVRQSHLGFLVYPAFVATKRRRQQTYGPATDPLRRLEHQVTSTANSRALGIALTLERALGRWLRYPIGIRCLIVGLRP